MMRKVYGAGETEVVALDSLTVEFPTDAGVVRVDLRLHVRHGRRDHLLHIEWLCPQRQLTPRDARDVQEVLDQLRLQARVALDDLGALGGACLVQCDNLLL